MSAQSAAERIIWLHKRIKDGCYPNAMRLSERFGISHRQAQRDVDYLRTVMDAPIVYCASRGGYEYTSPFSLPESIRVEDPEDYVELFVTAEREAYGDDEAMQLRIPYTAVLHIPNRLKVTELGKFIVGRAQGQDMYRCEFRNIGFFLGALLAADEEIRIEEPQWLRERLMTTLEKLFDSNRE